MQRRVLSVTEQKREQFGQTVRFSLRGNGIPFEELCHIDELSPKRLEQINHCFRNSLRYVKHYAGYPDKSARQKDMEAAMNALTQTDTGIGIKIKDDPLREFTPFQ